MTKATTPPVTRNRVTESFSNTLDAALSLTKSGSRAFKVLPEVVDTATNTVVLGLAVSNVELAKAAKDMSPEASDEYEAIKLRLN